MTMDIVKAGASNEEDEQIIKPQASTPALDTSDWPLLLKNYSKRTSLDLKQICGIPWTWWHI